MQLDLFDHRPRPTRLFWFPVRHRQRLIQAVARNLLARDGEKRAKRWRLECNRIHGEMCCAGFRDQWVIAAELADFRVVVESEMRRQVITGALDARRGGAA